MRLPDESHVVAGHVIGGDGSGSVAVPAQVCILPSFRYTLVELRPCAAHGLDCGQDGRVVDHLAEMLIIADPRLEVAGLEDGDGGIDGPLGDVCHLVVGVEDLEQTVDVRDRSGGQNDVALLQFMQDALKLVVQPLIGDDTREHVEIASDIQA